MDNPTSSIRVSIRIRPFSTKEASLLSCPSPSFTPFGSSSTTSLAPSVPSVPSHSISKGGAGLRRILKVLDDRVLVFDPPDTNPLSQFNRQVLGEQAGRGKKVKDMRFCFDRVFDENAGQEEVYEGSAAELVKGVMAGFNGSVFAYGATGCGKTHTISGTPQQPGLVFLIMRDLFQQISSNTDVQTELSISYLEVYNETIRDLLSPSGVLQLRELEGSKMSVPGLSEHIPTSPEEVIAMIHRGNSVRTVSPTEANATSSRSHAVLFINVKTRQRGGTTDEFNLATLNVIDLAGSERASVTKNRGERLVEGANINRSLLALGNCINALCDPRKRNHVPYRDSKLTRLLKHSLGGNCRTSMIVCLSPSSAHYDETHNTLKYANRAKEIKTKVLRNTVSVDRHVSQYVRVILELRQEVAALKAGERTAEEAGREKERRERKEGLKVLEREWEKVVGFSDERVGDLKRRAARAGAGRELLHLLKACTEVLKDVKAEDADWNRFMDEMINRLHNTKYDIEPFAQASHAFWETAKFHQAKVEGDEASEKWRERERVVRLEIEVEEEKGRVEGRVDGQRLLLQVLKLVLVLDPATQNELISKLSEAFNSPTSVATSTSPTISPAAFATSAFPGTFAGIKRSTSSDREMDMDVDPPSRPGKAPRISLAQASPPASRRASLSTRPKAQRKPSRLSVSSGPGILRASHSTVAKKTAAAPAKAVGWRDQNGEDLESVHANSSTSWSSDGNLTKNSEADVSTASSRFPSGEFSFTAPSVVESMAAIRQQRAARVSTLGTGSKKIPASKGTVLGSLGEEDESTASIDTSTSSIPVPRKRFSIQKPSSLERPPLRASISMANTSMAGTTNGLVAPIVMPSSDVSSSGTNENKNASTPRKKRAERTERRTSNIGPIRSAKKIRRSSVLMPPPPRRIFNNKEPKDENPNTRSTARKLATPRKAKRPSGIGSATSMRTLKSRRESTLPVWK
ncbi:kinesin-domain-containing protein [Atractiella rhizophila]|nr:kinesin-domain-containing protein [Atractiella rhizophila]